MTETLGESGRTRMIDPAQTQQLVDAIAAQEQLRGSVADDIIETSICALEARLAQLTRPDRAKSRKFVTVLFADVTGSTNLGEHVDAEELSSYFDVLWDRVDSIIQRHGGRIDKHIGDAVMGVWGTDRTDEDDPERAVRAGLDVLAALAIMRADRTLPELSMRIGVNSGPAVVGAIASTDEVTAMGDTVNVAARLEAAAPVGALLIGHDTYQHVRGVFTVAAQPPLVAKGKRQPLRTYIVHGVRRRAFRLPSRAIEGVEAPMIGRDDELEHLQMLLGEVEQGGSARSILITGEAGIGKTRLIDEFEDWLHLRSDDVRLFRGRGDAGRRATPYRLLRELLFARFEIADDDADELAVAKISIGLRQLGDEWLATEAPFVGHLVGLNGGPDVAAESSRGDPAERVSRIMVRLLALVAAQMPAVVLLEDLQWADRATLDLIESVIHDLSDERVLIVAASRPAHDERWWPLRTMLDPLSADDTAVLVERLLVRVDGPPRSLIDDIVRTAAGNPFYVEELLRMLIDDGVIRPDGDDWSVHDELLGHIDIPTTISGLIEARLDRLPPDERTALRRAAIVGREFGAAELPHVECGIGTMPIDLTHVLDDLVDRGLLERHSPTGAETLRHRFQHGIVHDVTYESVLRRDRRLLHRDVAERLAGNAGASVAAAVARHFDAAGAAEEAGLWFARAGSDARWRCAADEAIEACTAALRTGALDPDANLATLDDICSSLVIAARYDDARRRAVEMETLAERIGRPLQLTRALMHRSHIHIRMGENSPALHAARRAHSVLADDPVASVGDAAIDVTTEVAWVLLRLGRAAESIEWGERARSLVDVGTSLQSRRAPHTVLGAAHSAVGDYDAAAEHLSQALLFDRQFGDQRNVAANLNNLGEVARLSEQVDRATSLFGEALAIARQIGDIDQEALIESNLGGAYVAAADAVTALEHLDRAIDMFERSGSTEHLSETRRFSAEAMLQRGDLDGATHHAHLALELAQHDENADHLGHAHRVIGLIALSAPHPDRPTEDDPRPVEHISQAVAIFEAAAMTGDQAVALRDLANAYRQLGDDEGATDADRAAAELDSDNR